MTPADAAKRCSCGPCRPKLEKAIERCIRVQAAPLVTALDEALATGPTEVHRLVLSTFRRKYGQA